ncbi:bifunctional phosphopantothenoylcysteine decarboxylase/phosphopantothenate--cysteine ligase CoaBC [Georgenia sp. EYE_87]|uniref:bifunctional phosphopantothenoylcysteine decarboxylase/phosphopantothenate--cysteine ligase CoaBC n=1 Tax=Georgenia sp. EYE_87 TaxID=2853448 RepID=UPI0020065313|nr:bifunctional phosphopantothenoylcysteine decarboxylase/phosphopantothenate--cysteine ligase CoaBC [Georgenia sp. EYE_87]MCK6209201.1 bifunctional phosphopantothenoylcysteine decarboxylase/phosphopantothenate--cysteine ligase CoaBC [Georgenia sp. EYE_87]
MRIVLGVTGGIAAYKAALVLRLLREAGHRVRVVPTEAALRMVGRPTWEALSGEPVRTDVFDDAEHVDHVALGRGADLVIVAPATANLLAKAAAGLADDLLSTTLLTVTCPVLLAPAMHTEMWLHAATQANVATLRGRGVHVLDPDSGRLTGADTGPGRLPEPAAIVAAALALVSPAIDDLAGRSVVVSAGGTREPIDPVRFLGNRSSGRQGVALAVAAARRGATVTLVAANVDDALVPDHPAIAVRRVETTLELRDAVRDAGSGADVVVMAAAVADFRPATTTTHKIKKTSAGPAPIELETNPDILAELAAERLREGQVVVGFAAETGDATGDVLAHGREKARRKGADLLAVNEVGADRGFGDVPNEVTILDGEGSVVGRGSGTKAQVADAVWDAVAARLRAATTIER